MTGGHFGHHLTVCVYYLAFLVAKKYKNRLSLIKSSILTKINMKKYY